MKICASGFNILSAFEIKIIIPTKARKNCYNFSIFNDESKIMYCKSSYFILIRIRMNESFANIWRIGTFEFYGAFSYFLNFLSFHLRFSHSESMQTEEKKFNPKWPLDNGIIF